MGFTVVGLCLFGADGSWEEVGASEEVVGRFSGP